MIRPILGAAAALTFAALPAFAASDKFEMELSYSRAALDTPAGAVREYDQIAGDIHDRCVAENAGIPFSPSFAVRYCETRTMTSAVRAINHPNFTAVHEAANSH
jgi:UrcA family protein